LTTFLNQAYYIKNNDKRVEIIIGIVLSVGVIVIPKIVTGNNPLTVNLYDQLPPKP